MSHCWPWEGEGGYWVSPPLSIEDHKRERSIRICLPAQPLATGSRGSLSGDRWRKNQVYTALTNLVNRVTRCINVWHSNQWVKGHIYINTLSHTYLLQGSLDKTCLFQRHQGRGKVLQLHDSHTSAHHWKRENRKGCKNFERLLDHASWM